MQRKVFMIGGAPFLATRDGSLLETARTLQRMIAERPRRQVNLPAPPDAVAQPAARPEAPALSRPEPAPVAVEVGLPPLQVIEEAAAVVRAKPARPGPRGERWRTAGPERRGRTIQHWSTRRKA